ncbi:hypothetical protein [Microbacterium hydrocarbonoxydans]|uniref:hypothetical protein n=1 Tax=Microbacterium hydrocarbonoxydans TaxID=273678 RepID=UPI0013DC179E|nr:hypothetical protein [Microbacterium hydrocarbonoxydans]
MRSYQPWRRGASALLALALPAAFGVLTAADEGEGDGPPPNGAVEIPFQETGDIRPGEGWLIDCGRLGELDGVTVACEPDGISLTAEGYDPDWGERPLAVELVSASARLEVTYSVRLGPPPAPEMAVDRLDLPVRVGEQAMVPLSALGITCAVCSEEGGATIEVGTLPPGFAAGVSATHLSLRGSAAGDVAIPLRVTDDAGQQTTAELTVSFVEGGVDRASALHIVSPASEWDLASLSWGEDRVILCTGPQPDGLTCEPDGAAELSGDGGGPAQFLFRVIAADGEDGWGSITVDESLEGDEPAAPSWADEAPLHLVYPPAGEDSADVSGSLLGPLSLLLEGMSGR